MLEQSRLSIDFGSSYSKLSYRPAVDEKQHRRYEPGHNEKVYEVPTSVATFPSYTGQRVAWVPSIVAHVERTNEWYFGERAAGLQRTEGVRPYVNWKRHLFFAPENPEMREVCSRFFRFLIHTVGEQVGLTPGTRVRIAVPALPQRPAFEEAISACMAGLPVTTEFESEPFANTIGAFSRGRNGSWIPPMSSRLAASRGRTFRGDGTRSGSSDLLESMRRSALKGAKGAFAAVVLDLGAFTCDVARIELNLEDEALPPLQGDFRSADLGLAAVDARIFVYLEGVHGVDVSALPFGVQEDLKRHVYAGGDFNLEHEGRVLQVLASEREKTFLARQLDEYVSQAWEYVRPLLRGDNTLIIATGGPLQAPEVRRRLTAAAEVARCRLYLPGTIQTSDCQLIGVPDAAEDLERESGAARGWAIDLDRLATSIGGACCILDAK